jgi:hypothetical protein
VGNRCPLGSDSGRIHSKVGGTICGMLTDAEAFYEYDNRENVLAQQAHQEQDFGSL